MGERSRVQIPFTPSAAEYDLILMGRRLNGDADVASSLAVGFIAQGRPTYMRLGRSFIGIGDGNSLRLPNMAALDLQLDAPFTLPSAIRKNSVRFDVNGKTAYEFTGDFNQLTKGDVPNPNQLHLITFSAPPFEITSYKYVPVSAAAPSTPIAPAAVDLLPLVQLPRDAVKGEWPQGRCARRTGRSRRQCPRPTSFTPP